MTAVTGTEKEVMHFCEQLERICAKQREFSTHLEELIELLMLPSEDVLRILKGLLVPMDQEVDSLLLSLGTLRLKSAQEAT